jgi:hypothetical protein
MINVEGSIEELKQVAHSQSKELETARKEIHELRQILYAAFPSLTQKVGSEGAVHGQGHRL